MRAVATHSATAGEGTPAVVEVLRPAGDRMVIVIRGNWLMKHQVPGVAAIEAEIRRALPTAGVEFDTAGLGEWDSGLLNFVWKCQDLCRLHQIPLAEESLPPGVKKLIRLARAVPETKDANRSAPPHSLVATLGEGALHKWEGERAAATFLGSTVLALLKLVRGRAQFRWSDTLMIMQQCGPEALAVVALINFLIGVILAFVGAVQLRQFGASIYVADMVAIAAVREMGCIMTGIILCGRTGAAFAAQLGAMKVNEEIDAFRTFAISPIEFLVLPRIIALLCMMPLLCVFADVISILGGFLVAISMLDVTVTEYVNRTLEAITLKSFALGIFKGGFFGIIVALSGCLRGMQCGTNAAAVGLATTSAVVTGITLIVAADGLFAVLCDALKI